jgi:Right handed beta helix region
MSPRKLCCVSLLPAILCLIGIRASAQASVSENATAYIYVDANSGSDGNSGAANSPFQSIQAAIDKADNDNQNGVGVKVIVKPGVYREAVTIGNYRSTGASLIIEAPQPGSAIISGSDQLTGWNDEGGGIYSHPWSTSSGDCPVPSGWPASIAEIGRRADMVFIDGAPLTQVIAQSQLRPGTFFVSDGRDMMYVYPASGVNIYSATVEAAHRNSTLNLAGRNNVVLRGLVFRHAASCINNTSVNIYGSSNVLIDSVQALWNNWAGLGIYTTNNVTVQNSVASHNGGVGIMAANDQNALLNSNQTDYNNWRGAQTALFDWGMGGAKLMYMRNATVQNHFSYNNQAQGLWFDTDNQNIHINNATLSGNVMAGLQIEASQGPVTLQNSNICSNGAGVNVLNTPNMAITSNTLYNNGGTGIFDPGEIFVAGFSNGHPIIDWITGQYFNLFTTGLVLNGNTIANAGGGQELFGTYLKGNDWSQFANSVSAWNNHWSDPATPTSFSLVNGQKTDLSGWQAAVGSDWSSSWSSAPGSQPGVCYAPATDRPDFSLALNRPSYTMKVAQATARIRVQSFGTGSVNLWVTGLPGGVSASLSQNSIVGGQVALTLSAASWAATQTVPVTVWGSDGARTHSMTFNLNVSPN